MTNKESLIVKPFRGMTEPQMSKIYHDLVLIEYSDPGARYDRMSTNTYALSLLLNSHYSPFVYSNIILGFIGKIDYVTIIFPVIHGWKIHM